MDSVCIQAAVMADTQKNVNVPKPTTDHVDVCDSVSQDLTKLLTGEAVPVTFIDLKRNDAMHFVPKTKENVVYIVMTVLFNEFNQVLMVQEAKKSCYGLWYLPAGRLEPNETLLNGAMREVKEESALDCDITSLISVHFGGAQWIRLSFIGKITGGTLKSLAQKDEESLQAMFYDIDSVINSKIKLRNVDIIPVIQQALSYKESLSSVPLHPKLLPATVEHARLLHRFVVIANQSASGLHVLISSKSKPHTLICAVSPNDPTLLVTVQTLFKELMIDETFLPAIHGILGIEHLGCGNSQDGMCISTLVSLAVPEGKGLPTICDKSYSWFPVTDVSAVNIIHRGLKGHIVKFIDRKR